MDRKLMNELLSKGEQITVEYKLCSNGINDDVYETVCSFSNRYGGYIILGVDNEGNPVGVNKNLAQDMKKNFVNTLNNPSKISPCLYLEIEEFDYDGKLLLWTYVPPSSSVIKCSGRIYDRNQDGDYDITDSPVQLQSAYNRKSTTYIEHRIFPYVTKDDLRMDLMDKVRNLARSKGSSHPWLSMSDDEILKSAGLYEKDFSSGLKGYNLAAVLLFGKDETIRSCCPGYITDAIYRKNNFDRYDDRIQVKTNLIEAFDILMDFIARHTDDRFFLINNVNTSVRDLIAREVVGNILVHRDYSSSFLAKIIVTQDWLTAENWCIPRRHGLLMSDEFQPYPKNPLIQQFFNNIGRTDSIGSGVKNLYKYTPIYSDGGKPELFEDDVFTTSIPLNRDAYIKKNEANTLSERQKEIYSIICENPCTTVEDIMKHYDLSRSTIFRDYEAIKKALGCTYSKKTGMWKL